MKVKTILTLIAAAFASIGSAQTNTFPSSGNVGIGTISPNATFEVLGNGSAGTPAAIVNNTWSAYSNEAEDNRPFLIRRSTSNNEQLAAYVQDQGLFFNYKNDETNSSIHFRLRNLDIEGSDGSFASDRTVLRLHSGQYGSSATIDGFLGVGTSTPAVPLDVFGEVNLTAGAQNRIKLANSKSDTTNANSPKLSFFAQSSGSSITGPSIQKINTGTYGRGDLVIFQHNLADYTSEQEVMRIHYSGNVGIGTSNPTHKLSVSGTIRSKEVIVETGWSDFVFEDGYDLRSLNEVEDHIDEHGHLPDVPSAKIVESEGLSVGEAQKIMMQKIEELTLYMIEKDKQIEELQKEVEKLKSN